MTEEIHSREQNTALFIGNTFISNTRLKLAKKEKAIAAMSNQNENENDKYTK